MVDDDNDILWVCQKVLSEEGFSVDIANDSEEAIRKARLNHYHIFILDYMMPKLGGEELAKQILAINKHAVFIFLTGYYEFSTISKDLDLLTHLILLKPINDIELIHAVRENIEYLNYTSGINGYHKQVLPDLQSQISE